MTTAEYEIHKKLAEQAPLPVLPVGAAADEARRAAMPPTCAACCRAWRAPAAHARRPIPQPCRERPPLVVDRHLRLDGALLRLFRTTCMAWTRRHLKVHTFVFGTRLTNIHALPAPADPIVALKMADELVHDWKGGSAHRHQPRTSSTAAGAPRARRQRAVLLVS